MRTANYTDLRANLKGYIDSVIDDYDTVIVNRGNGKGVVMISLDEYNSLKETVLLYGLYAAILATLCRTLRYSLSPVKVAYILKSLPSACKTLILFNKSCPYAYAFPSLRLIVTQSQISSISSRKYFVPMARKGLSHNSTRKISHKK